MNIEEFSDSSISEEEIQNLLQKVLNQNYHIWNMKEIIFHKSKIKNPLIKIRTSVFKVSNEAKLDLKNLRYNDFFQFYDWDIQAFISKQFEMDLIFDDGEEIKVDHGRIYLHVKGDMFYSRMEELSNKYKNLINLEDLCGNLTKAARC